LRREPSLGEEKTRPTSIPFWKDLSNPALPIALRSIASLRRGSRLKRRSYSSLVESKKIYEITSLSSPDLPPAPLL